MSISSRHRGFWKRPTGTYTARISDGKGRSVCLGTFNTEEEAAQAYQAAYQKKLEAAAAPATPRGVTKRPEGTYTARITNCGKTVCLGTFKTAEEAARAYNAAYQQKLDSAAGHAAPSNTRSSTSRRYKVVCKRPISRSKTFNVEQAAAKENPEDAAASSTPTPDDPSVKEDQAVEEVKLAKTAAESSQDATAQNLLKACLEADRLKDKIKMLQEYHMLLHQYNATLQANAVKDGEDITKLKNENNGNVECLKQRQGEMKQLLSRIFELEMQQDAKQELDEESLSLRKKIEEQRQELDDKIEDLDHLRDLNQVLIVTECKMNDVVQKVRNALITRLKGTHNGRASIGIKRMGEINCNPFQKTCKERFPSADAKLEAADLLIKWQDEIKNPAWHPYKRIMVDGKEKEVINEEDEKLQGLKKELGEAVYVAVSKALLEMNEHNPIGKYPVQELWHFKKDRVASLREVVQYVFKTHKRKRS